MDPGYGGGSLVVPEMEVSHWSIGLGYKVPLLLVIYKFTTIMYSESCERMQNNILST